MLYIYIYIYYIYLYATKHSVIKVVNVSVVFFN